SEIQKAVGKSNIGSGCDLQMQSCGAGGWGSAWINHNERSAILRLCMEILHDGRHSLGRVAASQKNCFRMRNIGERERKAAVDAERLYSRCGGGRHAETAVVIDLRSAQGNPREFAEQIGFFVGETATAEHADRVAAELFLDALDASGDVVERFIPGDGLQGIPALGTQQRRSQALRMIQQFGGGPAFLAETSAIGGEIARPHASLAAL